jgi:hypothetical protein
MDEEHRRAGAGVEIEDARTGDVNKPFLKLDFWEADVTKPDFLEPYFGKPELRGFLLHGRKSFLAIPQPGVDPSAAAPIQHFVAGLAELTPTVSWMLRRHKG